MMALRALIFSFLALTVSVPHALAQNTTAETDATRREARAKSRDKDAARPDLGVYRAKAAGACPYVSVLWDASRYVEMVGPVSSSNAGFTGEIQGVDAECAYEGGKPITVKLTPRFALGKGPKATSNTKQYIYWVAVTRRNVAVINKERFALPVEFNNTDRVMISDHVDNIVIPRAGEQISGSNFEIIVGFELTAEQVAFNRTGQRFRVDAGAAGQ